MKNMYLILLEAEKTCHTIEIRERATGKRGVANSDGDKVAVFYGAADGSDDKRITPEQFNTDFEVTYTISG